MAWILSLSKASIPFHPSCTSAGNITTLLRFIMARNRPFYLALIAVALLVGCAPLRPLSPGRPISQDQAHYLITQMRAQANEVFSFVGMGKLLFRKGQEETYINLLAVGQRPSRIRLELTHTWGKPLIFLVADKRNTSLLSFIEHTFYSGPSTGLQGGLYFPFELDLEAIWVILSGRIPILSHCRVESLGPNEITLFDGQGQMVERLTFAQDCSIPTSIHIPGQGLTVALSQFKQGGLGPYPSKISISQGDELHVEIRYTSIEFNRPIPEELFALNPPPDVRIIRKNDQGQ
ncbi:MAG: hypothetical protein AVO38_10110 [delta proteobacterium ML8_D]|jgi:hypothetical protein|nr:MAG: hypothetical protein AVO38_10110 [delta proteobacterium ML8_D]